MKRSLGPAEIGFFGVLIGVSVLLLFVQNWPEARKPEAERPAHRSKPIDVTEIVKPPPPPPPPEASATLAPKSLASAASALAPSSLAAFAGFGGDGGGVFGADVGGGVVGEAGGLVLERAGVSRAARALSRVAPEYPREAREKNISGYVLVQVLVGPGGGVEQAKVLESEPAGVFDSAALAAVRGWKFEPAIGKTGPVASWVTQRIRFALN